MKVLFAALFALSVCFFPPTVCGADDESEIRSVLMSFGEALKSRNIEALKAPTNWTWNEPGIAYWKDAFESGDYAKYPITDFDVSWVQVDGENASDRVKLSRIEATTGAPYNAFMFNFRVFFLTRSASGWKITKFDNAENDLITRLLRSDSFEERKQMIRVEK